MLHLVYRFRPTVKARSDLAGFWRWIADRQLWFYADLPMVRGAKWFTVTIGDDVHCLEHHVTFDDEAGWGSYRREIARRSADPQWESRRTGQDEWYEIIDARILTDPPIPILLPESQAQQQLSDIDLEAAVQRSHTLLARARFVTLATHGPGGPWAATVNYVVLTDPLRLIWYSLHDAVHSTNIAVHPTVSGSLFRTGLSGAEAPSGIPIDGAQLCGRAREVTDAELPAYYEHYYDLNFPDPETRAQWRLPLAEFHGDGPRRFYRLDIDRLWLYNAHRWTQDKHDTRFEVPVTALQDAI